MTRLTENSQGGDVAAASLTAESRAETRKAILLRAAYDLLKKQERSGYVLNVLEQTAFYDGTDCDGYCLMQDIADELDIEVSEMPLKDSPAHRPDEPK